MSDRRSIDKAIKNIVRALCGLTGMVILVPPAFCIIMIFFPLQTDRLVYETLNGAYYATEPQVMDECTTASGEVIRFYENYDENGRGIYKITYQASGGEEQMFYDAYRRPFVDGIECTHNTVIVRANSGNRMLYLPLKRIRTELVEEPLCYGDGFSCVEFGIIGEIVGTGILIAMYLGLVLWIIAAIYLLRIAITGKLGAHR